VAELDRPKVLVVDDDSLNRSLLRSVLASTFAVTEAQNGSEALAFLPKLDPDVVLLDVMMPGMSGHDVCRLIKARQDAPFLPVILLTALGDQDDRNAGLMAGADDFLTKPFDRRELLLRTRAFAHLRRSELLVRAQIRELAELQALKDDLVSLIVHDMRNPLTGMIAVLDVLAHESCDDPAQARQDASDALHLAHRLHALLDDVLQVRMLEEGELRLQIERLSLADVSREAAVALQGEARARHVEVAVTAAEDPVAPVDRKLARRCVENLIANAIKFSRAGDRVEVNVLRESRGVRIDVADRGPGVPEEAKKAVFERFGSVQTRTDSRRGFGLGLYLVSLALAAHGGSAAVLDRPGGGSVFQLVFPATQSQPA
jgi:two-component system sensor histidine kinase/response regulator